MDLNINAKLDVILRELEEIKNQEAKLKKSISNEPYQSEKTDELNLALSEASLEYPPIKINRQNPYLRAGYSDLHEIMKKIRPILGKFKLHISQIKKQADGRILLVTRVWHSSGQWIESRLFLTPTKNTIEAYGSRLNSMKRFEVMDILGITVSGDPYDDDGEADMADEKEVIAMGAKLRTLYDTKQESFETIASFQYEELMLILDDNPALVAEILEELKIKTLRDMPKSRFKPTVDRIHRLNEKRSGR